MPGLLILDGLSANAGREGFDQDRIHDVYRLLSAVADQYRDALQVAAVDNYLASNILDEYSGCGGLLPHWIMTPRTTSRVVARKPAATLLCCRSRLTQPRDSWSAEVVVTPSAKSISC